MQTEDSFGNPVVVLGRPVLHASPVDDGLMWTEATYVLHNDRLARDVAQIQLPKNVHHVATEFLAHLVFGHCGDAVL